MNVKTGEQIIIDYAMKSILARQLKERIILAHIQEQEREKFYRENKSTIDGMHPGTEEAR